MSAVVAMVAVTAASAIAQGLMSSSAAKANAYNAQEWAEYNAAVARQVGKTNALATAQFAQLNAQMLMMGASAEAAIANQVAKYNAGIRLQISEANAKAFESEIPIIWDAANLDTFKLEQEIDQISGANRTAYGFANVRLDEGTPLQAEISLRTQEAMDAFVIKHNAQIAVARMVDKASMSRWQGKVEAGQILYEGRMSGATSLMRGTLAAGGVMAQGMYDATIGRYNAGVESRQLLSAGFYQSKAYDAEATRALVNTGFKVGTAVASYYGRTYTPGGTGVSGAGGAGGGGSRSGWSATYGMGTSPIR